MNGKMKKILSLVLSVVLLVSVLSIGAVAEGRNVKHVNNYLILGDSNAAGYGLVAGDDMYGYVRPQGQMIQGLYGTLVAQETGAKVYNYARCGFRTEDIRRLLDPSYQYDDYSDTSIGYMGGTNLEEFTQLQQSIRGDIAKADVITLNVGANDMFTQGMMYASRVIDDTYLEIGGTNGQQIRSQLAAALSGGSTSEDSFYNAIYQFFGYCYMAGVLPAALAAFVSGFSSGEARFSSNWDAIVKMIREINPNCTLIAIGLMNPFKHCKLTGASMVEIGALTDGNTTRSNDYIQNQCPYRDQYIYCDVTGASEYVFMPRALVEADMINNMLLYVHPTLEGHRYYADAIEACIGSDPGSSPVVMADHSVYLNSNGPGTANVNVSTAKAGEDTCITAIPNEGNRINSITVTDGSGNAVAVKKLVNNTYYFTMPASDVRVDVSFGAGSGDPDIGGGGSSSWEAGCPSASYVDMTPDAWYHTSVDYVLNRGIMTGTSGNTFEPNSNLTRAMVCTILYAMEGKPRAIYADEFSDVRAGDWYLNPVYWCASNGIVAGMGDGSFGPNNNVTREQLATMLRSYARYKGKDVSAKGNLSGFADSSSVSSWAAENMAWAVGAGIISGRDGGMLAPQGTATRAEAATMFYKFCTNVIG